MLKALFHRLLGADCHVLAEMSLLSAERRGVAAAGLYLLLLALVSAMSSTYLASLALDLYHTNLFDHGWALVPELLSGVAGFFLVWNSYQLMLLTQLPQVDEPPDAIRAVSRAFVKLLIAAMFGACFGVLVALALSPDNPSETVILMPSEVVTPAQPSEALQQAEQALLARYLERQRLTRALELAQTSQTSAPQVSAVRLQQQLAQVGQEITDGHLARQSGANHALGMGAMGRGIASRLHTLVQHSPVFLALTVALLAFFFSVPVLQSATRRKGAYAYLLAMQNIRCLAAQGIVPRADVIPGFRGHPDFVRHRFLRAEQLAQAHRGQLREIDRGAASAASSVTRPA